MRRVAAVRLVALLFTAACTTDRATAPPGGPDLRLVGDRGSDLQATLDACAPGSTCTLPPGVFVITHSLHLDKSLTIVGAGRAGNRGGRFTEIRVAGERPAPALVVTSGHDVRVSSLTLARGGIRFGGDGDPCRGIDGPIGRGSLDLADMSIVGSQVAAVHFNGGSLTARHVEVKSGAGSGVYVAGAQDDIVMQGFESSHHRGWGIYICNRTGNGLIFLNGGHLDHNGRGGLAIVGGGGPAPSTRPACLQNIELVGNRRFGLMLFEAAVETLVFNVFASGTTPDADGAWGDGIAVGSSSQVVFWDVKSWHNARVGVSAFDCLPGEPTEVLVVGGLSLVENPISMDYEHLCAASSDVIFESSQNGALINGCGSQFLAPATDTHCVENGATVACQVKSSHLAPPVPNP